MSGDAALSVPADGAVEFWGPDTARHEPARQAPVDASPVRFRRPWGLGDVWLVFGALIGVQMLLLPVLIVAWLMQAGVDLSTLSTWTAQDWVAMSDSLTEVAKAPGVLVVAMVAQWAVFAGVPWWASRRKGLRSLAADYGMRFTVKDHWRGLGLAVVLQVAALGSGWLLQRSSLDLSGADNATMVTDQRGVMLAVMVLAATVAAPLTEELLFRGLVLRSLLRSFAHVDLADDPHFTRSHARDMARKGKVTSERRRRVGTALAIVVSAVIFGALHMPMSDGTAVVTTAAQVVLVTQTGALGLVFAVVAYRMRRMGVNVWAHVYFNAISVALALAFGAGA